jgi:L-iditol 2-dehydrogenase
MDEAALGEPTACAIYAGMESGVRLGDTVLVVGMGFAGQVIAQVAKKMGAKKVIVCDLVDEKLKLAKALGADIVVNTATEDAVEVVLAETHGKGVDVAFEVAGNEEAIQICTDSVKHGGILGFYSWVLHPVNLLIDRWHDDGLEIRTLAVMHRIMHDMEWYQLNALSNVVNGNINIKDLMTHTFDLNDAAKAFECAIHEPTACKVLIRG